MDVSAILDPLNDAQREAVAAPADSMLVLAGAGSGKTRVLVHRIAWLIQTEGLSPYGILAVTFTNKAAAEMRARIEQLLGAPLGGMWVGTFHGMAHRLLRAHWREARLPQTFQILDSEDQYRVIRRVLKALSLDEGQWAPKKIQGYINGRKDEGLRAAHIDDQNDPYLQQMVRIYRAYQESCERSGLVDFAELLLRVHELWRECPDVLQSYQQRFHHILVDEFQDTNTLQYAWLRRLAGDSGRMFVVGDDDQSIYGWRGARIENIHRFNKDYAGARVVRLEQNYRSTATILQAANALIAHNTGRLGKKLWTSGEEGEPLSLYRAYNEMDEARYVVDRIDDWVSRGNRRSEVAILYRSNAQSRVFEEALLAKRMPYRVYGGLRFFERAEIKNALAYLRLIANRDDDASFERIVNTPTRGIGERSLQSVRDHARAQQLSLWRATLALCDGGALASRVTSALRVFIDLIDTMTHDTDSFELAERVDHVIRRSGLLDDYRNERSEKSQARVENLEELVTAARQFAFDAEIGMQPLDAFLAHAALEAGDTEAEAWEDCVQLMTLHTAKGLEFPVVFLCGAEEGLFPHQMSVNEPGRLEEERRLCYVGMTRAMRHLYISHAESRRIHGQDTYPSPSRFLGEIPAELMQEVRARPQITRPVYVTRKKPVDDAPTGLRLGQRVQHTKFGEGVILNYEGQGSHARVQVNFQAAGAKWLVVAYANLQAI
ncbi:MAG: DNA helicase II / ATP-dependent DNA helicase PcrA [Gammaproteobacteria bacterium]|nr:MAG: DNA helicase II / ATP-dependent DNA helicase PcrA [Gammaproteobacteria bacterium]TND05482.1 MAG: DNA helicase II / ATP-dependent DNA helicase PcrA [Gammaproteobacteria bacterium]